MFPRAKHKARCTFMVRLSVSGRRVNNLVAIIAWDETGTHVACVARH